MKQYVQSQHFTSTVDIMTAMKNLLRDVIRQVIEVEMDQKLGWERCQRTDGETASPNYRNGYSQKTVKTQLGEIDIRVPRDRKGNYTSPNHRKIRPQRRGYRRNDSVLVRLRYEPAGYCGSRLRACTMWRFLRNW